jgi:hypothetical protein
VTVGKRYILRMEKKKSTPKSSIKKAKSPAKSTKKSTTKDAPRRKEYKYVKLTELLKEEKQRVYLYAVVLDSSAPYYLGSIQKYLCTVKLIDDTVNPKSKAGKVPLISTTIFSQSKDGIPEAIKMGSILRIHRGDTKKYEKSFQLNCDVNIKGSWVLFDPTESFTPIAYTGQTYSFGEDDKKRVKDLRKFTESFLKAEDMTEAASFGAKKGELDFIGLVLNRKSDEKAHDKLAVFDGDEFLKISIPKDRYTTIAPQDIVRIRGLVRKGNDFIVNEYMNIIKVEGDYATAAEFQKKLENAKKDKDVAEKLEMYVPVTDKPRVVSEVLDKKAKLTSLKELFGMDASKLKEKHYRVSVNVLEIGPKDPKSWLVPIDAKARKQYSLPESVTHYYKLQLFSKDASAPEDHNIYTLYVCTIDGKGKEFIPLPSGKSKKGEKGPKELKRVYNVLTKPWITLDAIVEGVSAAGGVPIFFVVDTKLTL